MGYLDELKKESEKRQQQVDKQATETQTQQKQREERFRIQVKPALKRLRDYLLDLTEQLNYLKPETPVCYDIEGYGNIEDFQQENYRLVSLDNLDLVKRSLSSSQNETIDTRNDFLVRCVCQTPSKYRIKKHQESEVKLQREYFTTHNISFTCNEETDDDYQFLRAVFFFQPKIVVDFKFTAHFESSSIKLTLNNFSAFGENIVYTLKPDKINVSFLDELAKYITRQPHRFRKPQNNKPKKKTKLQEFKEKTDKIQSLTSQNNQS
ncbi:MAG: hypothetical protein KAH77_04665 [Thiomargarita sp.]|nr:hypothetical protein [Thiomargarita sp.]